MFVEKKTKVPSDTIVKPQPPGKRDKQLAGRISTRLGHMNTFKDWISFLSKRQ